MFIHPAAEVETASVKKIVQ